jgi:hypothetical protein
VKKGKAKDPWGKEREITGLDGIITHLTRECGRDVHDCHAVDVSSGSFEKETHRANPRNPAKKATDLKANSRFIAAYREKKEYITHARNSCACHDFKERRIVRTHCAVHTNHAGRGNSHLKSWLVETSADGEK